MYHIKTNIRIKYLFRFNNVVYAHCSKLMLRLDLLEKRLHFLLVDICSKNQKDSSRYGSMMAQNVNSQGR